MDHMAIAGPQQQNDATPAVSQSPVYSNVLAGLSPNVTYPGLLPRSSMGASSLAFPLQNSLPTLMRSPGSGLIVNEPGDVFEQEADRVADQVTRIPDPVKVQRVCAACEEEEKLQRKCAACEEEEEKTKVQRKEAGAGPAVAPPIVHEVLSSPGQPLDAGTRAFFEPRFGHDFSKVRVHADIRAAESARAAQARAYAVGNHVVFSSGTYDPFTLQGSRLLAHELTHVVQQSRGPVPFQGAPKVGKLAQETGPTLANGVVPTISSGPSASLQRQELLVPEELPFPAELGEFDIPELPDIDIEELPQLEELPELEEAPEMGTPEATPETTPEPAPAPEPTPEPTPAPEPTPQPTPEPFPPVVPKPGEPEEPDKDKDPCTSKRLPPTFVTFSLGPQGQGGTALASPLTRCPGNTRGSLADSSVYPKQFACIKALGLSRNWIPAHLLHGQTRRRPLKNLHGPGNEARNIIIAHTGLNRQMNASVEEPAILRVYDLNQVLWYESTVLEYFPGAEFFAKSIQVTYGLFDVSTGTRGPILDNTPKTFASPENPPACPVSLGPAATPTPVLLPPPTPADFTSTMKICLRVLNSRTFPVKNGGLKVTLRANWAPAPGTGPALNCPISDYFVSLEQKGLILDTEISTSSIPAGKSVTLTWRHLPQDDYFLIIFVPDHNPACCLTGDISVFTFDAPRPRRVPRGQMA